MKQEDNQENLQGQTGHEVTKKRFSVLCKVIAQRDAEWHWISVTGVWEISGL